MLLDLVPSRCTRVVKINTRNHERWRPASSARVSCTVETVLPVRKDRHLFINLSTPGRSSALHDWKGACQIRPIEPPLKRVTPYGIDVTNIVKRNNARMCNLLTSPAALRNLCHAHRCRTPAIGRGQCRSDRRISRIRTAIPRAPVLTQSDGITKVLGGNIRTGQGSPDDRCCDAKGDES